MLEQFDTLVVPHKPRVIVYYCGSNDVSGGEPADAIIGRIKQFVERVERALPGTQVFFVSINKAPSKRNRWDVVDTVNAEILRYSKEARHLGYIDVNPALFDSQGDARTELYLADMLHFKPPAYDAFTAIIKPVLARAWAAR
jgi:lysophospholipase L1-like esterase